MSINFVGRFILYPYPRQKRVIKILDIVYKGEEYCRIFDRI